MFFAHNVFPDLCTKNQKWIETNKKTKGTMTRKERWAMYAQGAMLAAGIMLLGWLTAQCSEIANSMH